MAYTLKDRVLVTSTSTGTGDFSLGSAVTGYQAFTVVGNGAQIPYTIQGLNPDGSQTGDWEVGIGTWYSAGNYITRDTVLESSNSGSKVAFPSGDKNVFLDLPGELVVQGPASSTNNNLAVFDGTTGKVLKDNGLAVGAANGVASLDSTGKVPTSQIPQMGDLNYQGTWNASTNTPTLTSSTGTKGYYYVVSVSGSTNLDGITDWVVGDWAVFNGTVWQKIDNTQAYPAAGIANSTGSAWGTSYSTTGTGTVVALQTSPLLVTPTLSGALVDNAAPYIDFASGAGTTLAAGRMWYDGSTGSWNLGMGGGNITQQVGEELFVYGRASDAITEGQVIAVTGSYGTTGVVTFAPAPAGLTDDSVIVGIATEPIAKNAFGRVTSFGTVHGLSTSPGFADGDVLWYDPSVVGGYTKTKPTAPNVKCQVGIVTKAAGGTNGSIQVDIIHGTSLGGTDSNVNMSAPSNGQILTYDGTNTYWKNTTLTAGTGISVSASATGVLTITNSAPSSGGTVTSVSGTGSVNGITLSGTVTSSGNITLGGTLSNVSLTSQVTGTLPIANGGTNATSAGAAIANLFGFTSTATAAGTTTLTNTSTFFQLFTGTTTQTVTLPVVTTLAQGWRFNIVNTSTGTVTVNSSGGNLVYAIPTNGAITVACIATTGTTAAAWVLADSTTAVWNA